MKKLILALVFLLLVGSSHARIIYVDNDGPADFNNIQAAIDDSNDGDTIIVADGTYTGDGNRDIDILGKAITLRSENGPENCIIYCENDGRGFYFHSGEDVNSVLEGFTITKGHADRYGGGIYCYLSSPTIKNCKISGNSANRYGGGICCRNNSSPTITDCTIRENHSSDRCGGLYGSGGPISNCTITGNSSVMTPGGLYKCTGLISNCTFSGNTDSALVECSSISNCTISNNLGNGLMLCEFVNNCIISGNSGWGLVLCGLIRNCTISGNTKGGLSGCSSVSNCAIIGNTGYEGGGLSGCVSITNCVIIGNTAEFGGGAARCDLINNCTFSNNRANGDGGGIYCYGNDTTVINCIMWGDTAPQGDEIALFLNCVCCVTGCICYPSSITVSYSDVQGGETAVYVEPECTLNWGEGNIDTDPCFADASNGDYHMKSQAGRWDPNSESWVQDNVTSPGIDTGDPMSPIGPEPFPNGGRINMGAYGGTAEASKSYFGEPVCETIVAGDINGDCKVNSLDFRLMALHWLESNIP